MCVIIHKPADARPSEDLLVACATNNPDGFGIMFVENGRIHTIKDPDSFRFFEVYDAYKDRELGIHFRWKTHGEIDMENTHPYAVLEPEAHDADLWLMHNGIISIEQRDKSKSDTWHFVRYMLRPILEQTGLDVIRNKSFQTLIEEYIGSSNKLLLLDQYGNFTKFNAHRGIELEDCWLSNNYSHTLNVWSGKKSQAAVQTSRSSYRWNYGLSRPYGYWEEDEAAWESHAPYRKNGVGKYTVQEGSGGVLALPAPTTQSDTNDYLSTQNDVDEDYHGEKDFDFLESDSNTARDYWFPSAEDIARFPVIELEDIEHLSLTEVEQLCVLAPDLVAQLLWRMACQ